MFDISAFIQGLSLGLSIFICPGSKDIFIVRQALLQHSPIKLIAVGTSSDVLLICLGMAGLSALLNSYPTLQKVALLAGVLLMLRHGFKSAREALYGVYEIGACDQSSLGGTHDRDLLAVSFLNPIVWLDTVLIVGTIGAGRPREMQLSFAVGAMCASLAWFICIVLAGRAAKAWVTAPLTWRILDVATAIFMFGLAFFIGAENFKF